MFGTCHSLRQEKSCSSQSTAEAPREIASAMWARPSAVSLDTRKTRLQARSVGCRTRAAGSSPLGSEAREELRVSHSSPSSRRRRCPATAAHRPLPSSVRPLCVLLRFLASAGITRIEPQRRAAIHAARCVTCGARRCGSAAVTPAEGEEAKRTHMAELMMAMAMRCCGWAAPASAAGRSCGKHGALRAPRCPGGDISGSRPTADAARLESRFSRIQARRRTAAPTLRCDLSAGFGSALEEQDFSWRSEWHVAELAVASPQTQRGSHRARVYGRPSEALWVCGCDRPNGKTSCSQ